jgi:hypothetical protein
MSRTAPRETAAAAAGPTVTKAIQRAANRLGISNRVIGSILGLSEASVSRMGSGGYVLRPGEKSFELSVLFVRLYRSLDAMTGGDDAVARTWLRSENAALGGTPLTLVQSIQGLVNVIAYLDTRRAVS